MAEAAAVTPATEATPAAEPTLEQQLEALKTETTPAAEATPPEGTPPAEATPPAEPTIEDKLKEIDEAPTETKPTLSNEQQQILNVIPNVQTAQQLATLANGYTNFTQTFERGQFGETLNMLQQWNPQATDAFMEHIYQTKITEWVDRWIADKEGNPTVHKGMQSLEAKISQLQSQLNQRNQQETEQQRQTRQAQIGQQYQSHLKGLFDKINFSEHDRRWVTADINSRVGADNAVLQAVNSGNMQAVNAIFKKAVTEYVQRDQQQNADKNKVLAAQDKKAPLIGSNPAVATDALPEDIKQVKKGQEDAWVDQELAKLSKKTGVKLK